ncbi:MAG TPA: Asp-tRNA(Asn)/Glu-tRNA(Gln) amidotransferase subunit GatC [Nitrososphaera sp.]|nr:Asp-tRNA(Asn)/Glu-tRNA(Gln) amidotransferase subunit GatC [Nitrososphaera sp.]
MVTKEEVKHLGWLARIELTDEELARYTSQIEEIIKYLDKLDTIPLEQVKPIVSRKKFEDLRPDEPADFEGDALGTKYRKDGFVKGPRMT